jgi:hypothetical protein
MNAEEFAMNLLIGGWIKTKCDEEARSEIIYIHTDSVFSMGTKEGSDKVLVYQNGKPLGSRHFEVAFNEIHVHMELMQDLAEGFPNG